MGFEKYPNLSQTKIVKTLQRVHRREKYTDDEKIQMIGDKKELRMLKKNKYDC